MDYKLKGGVLIIGSLFWQDDLYQEKRDGLRRNWRYDSLEFVRPTNVSVPIRYGRFSNDKVYTMIFDSSLSNEKHGKGKAIAFKYSPTDWHELKREVEALSSAEGKGKRFIKWSPKISEAWCICAICFNPKIVKEIKVDILSNWEQALMESKDGYKYFVKAPENFSLSAQGELQISWPPEATDFDYLIATSTEARKRDDIKELTVKEIADHVYNRNYFHQNIKHEITTYQDDEINNHLISSKV